MSRQAEAPDRNPSVLPAGRRVVLAILALATAGALSIVALFVAYGSSISFAPSPFPFSLAGPAALCLIAAAALAALGWRGTYPVGLVGAGAAVLVGFAALSSPFGVPLLALAAALAVGILAWVPAPSVVSPESPASPAAPAEPPFDARASGPPTRPTGLAWLLPAGLIAVLVVAAIATNPDPLRPSDVRTPALAGLVAEAAGYGSTAELRLHDGRRLGPGLGEELRDSSGRGELVGSLVLAGSSPRAWFVALDGFGAGCYQARTIGADDGDAVILRMYAFGGRPVGIRVGKASGFDPGPIRDGRYVGRAGDASLAARVAGPAVRAPLPRVAPAPYVPALAGYFCLDATGQATRWDPGY